MVQVKTKDFGGARVASLETRKAKEMAHLIETLGGKPWLVPSMKEVPLESHQAGLTFGEKLKEGQIDTLILMTGVGTKSLLEILSTQYSKEELKKKLSALTILARGPKPTQALEAVQIQPTLTIPEPNTWREILKTLDAQSPVEGKRVAVQEYGEPNKIFLSELKARGADVFPVPLYRAAMPNDVSPLQTLIERVIGKDVDVLLCTNSAQVNHLMAVARQQGKAMEFRQALSRVVVGSVGPSCSDTLFSFGLPVDVEPPRPMMGALVAQAAEVSSDLLPKKKAAGPKIQLVPRGLAQPDDPLYNSVFLKACRREPTERTPIWLMRQAGRYMKEYRELRAKVSFLDLCKNSDLASEVTVDAAHRLGVDAAIIFSDILLILEPMGFDLSYGKDSGPRIGNPFQNKQDLNRLASVDVLDSLRFVFEAIRKTRRSLNKDIPLIGFVGAPFTLASYCIEGMSSRNFIKTKKLMFSDPQTWHALMSQITQSSIEYLNQQLRAGAQAVQIFDSWAGCLSPEDYRQFVLPHTTQLIQGVSPGAPVISFGTQTAGLLPLFKQAGGDVVGVDWRIELDEAWDILGEVAIMGNLDPVALFSSPQDIHARAARILNQAGGRPGHIFNLGHGVLPETPIEHVLALVESVRNLSSKT